MARAKAALRCCGGTDACLTKNMPSYLRRVLLALCAFLPAAPASAWWDYGHKTIADIAQANVRPATRAAVEALLAKQALLETPTCPVGTMADASVWADCVKARPLRDRFSYMSDWHFQNADACRPFDLKAECRGGNCVSAQIDRQMRLIKDKTVPERERLQALVLLIHFVGDLHQPLHGADNDGDAGGNGRRSDYGIVQYDRLNLHLIWDGYLAERSISTPPSLIRTYPETERARLSAGTVEDWSREDWEIARAQVYPTAYGADYCKIPKDKRGAISNASIEALVPVVRGQVEKGGLRLARLLDEAFAG